MSEEKNPTPPPSKIPKVELSNLQNFQLPVLSASTGLLLMGVAAFFVFGFGYLTGANWGGGIGMIALVIGLIAVGAVVAVGWLTISSLIDTLATIVLVPYGIHDAKRARGLLMRALSAAESSSVKIREGEIAPDSDPSLLEVTRRGRGVLDVDATSAVLMDRAGKQELLSYGVHILNLHDRILGAVTLRAQRELWKYDQVFTRDAMIVSVALSINYQIIQDMRHLQRHGSHLASIDAVRHAVMPRPEWKERTKRTVKNKVLELIGQYQLWEIFVPATIPSTIDMNALAKGLSLGKPQGSVLNELSTRLYQTLQPLVSQWGVEISSISLDEIAPPKEIREKAQSAYDRWLESSLEIDKAAQQAEAERRIAMMQREHAELQRQTEIIHAETKASAERNAAEIEKATSHIRAETEAERKRFEAEADKEAAVIRAQADAEAHRIRMLAKTEAGVELARRLELLQQGTGRSLDDRTMREFLHAIGFLQGRDGHPEGRLRLRDLLDDAREEGLHERRFEMDDEEEE